MLPESAIVCRIAEEIARYLRAHPQAADSVEGIRQWWLTPIGPQPVSQVEAALAQLLGRGVVVRQVMPDGAVLYQAAGAEERDEA